MIILISSKHERELSGKRSEGKVKAQENEVEGAIERGHRDQNRGSPNQPIFLFHAPANTSYGNI